MSRTKYIEDYGVPLSEPIIDWTETCEKLDKFREKFKRYKIYEHDYQGYEDTLVWIPLNLNREKLWKELITAQKLTLWYHENPACFTIILNKNWYEFKGKGYHVAYLILKYLHLFLSLRELALYEDEDEESGVSPSFQIEDKPTSLKTLRIRNFSTTLPKYFTGIETIVTSCLDLRQDLPPSVKRIVFLSRYHDMKIDEKCKSILLRHPDLIIYHKQQKKEYTVSQLI